MPDKDSPKVFGHVIAYLLPGFLALWVVSSFDGVAATWFGAAANKETTVGGFLFVVLASLGLGLFVNGVGWLLFEEWLFRKIPSVPVRPRVDQAKRKESEAAYQDLRESHFRFFQFYRNTAVSMLLAMSLLTAKAIAGDMQWIMWGYTLGCFLFAEIVMFTCAKSSLTKYRERVVRLLGEVNEAA